MGEFHRSIAAFQNKFRLSVERTINRLATDMFHEVKERSPVDTGALRDSWTMSLNGLPSSFNGGTVTAKLGDIIYIATDKVYAPIIEFGLYPNPPKRPTGRTKNGYSTQAPNGVVMVTVVDFANRVRDGKY